MSETWETHHDKSVFVTIHTKNAPSAAEAAKFLLQVLCIEQVLGTLDSRDTDSNHNHSDRISNCSGLENVDHSLLDIVDLHSLSILFLNSQTKNGRSSSPAPAPRGSFISAGEGSSGTFIVPDADQCMTVAIELGGVIVSEVLNDEDKAYFIRTPYEYSFVVIETTKQSTQHIAFVYLKATSSETLLSPTNKNSTIDNAIISSPRGERKYLSIREEVTLSETVTSQQALGVSVVKPSPKQQQRKKNKSNKRLSFTNTNHASKQQQQQFRKLWDPITGRINPFLHPYMLLGQQYRLITPNATDPIPFSNDVFEGKMLLMVRSSLPMDEKYSERFDVDKNMFELQVQGRFKRIPAGYMYLGGEITKKMELGLLTKGLASSLLQFCKSFNASIHHSYGDNTNTELPHIVGPFWSTIDRVVVTPPGELPPPFIKGFPEPPESRAARRAGNPLHSVRPVLDLESTYSFSFKTRYVDLESWAVVSVPFMKEFKFQTFWNDSDLRFIAYFIDPEKVELDAKGFPKLHSQDAIERIFTLELQNASNHPEWKDNPSAAYYAPQEAASPDDAEIDLVDKGDSLMDDSEGSIGEEQEEDEEEEEEEEEQLAKENGNNDYEDFDSEDDFFDAQDGYSPGQRKSIVSPASAATVAAAAAAVEEDSEAIFQAAMYDIQQKKNQHISNTAHHSSGASTTHNFNISPATPLSLTPSTAGGFLLSPSTKPLLLDRRYSQGQEFTPYVVTAVIDVDELRKTSSNNRRTLYAFTVFSSSTNAGEDGLTLANRDSFSITSSSSGNVNTTKMSHTIFRTYKEWKNCLPVIKASKKQHSYDRWSESEQRRWQLDDSYRYLLQDAEKNHASRSRLETFLIPAPHTDTFLHNTILSSTQTTQSPHSPTFHRLMTQLDQLRSVSGDIKKMKETAVPASNTNMSNANSSIWLPASMFTTLVLSQLESNVCVRVGNFHWSQEHFSINVTDAAQQQEVIVLRRPGKRLGTISKRTIPLCSVLDVRPLIPPQDSSSSSNHTNDANHYNNNNNNNNAALFPIQLPDISGIVITTFPKQYVLLVRGGSTARDIWIQALQIAVTRAILSNYPTSSTATTAAMDAFVSSNTAVTTTNASSPASSSNYNNNNSSNNRSLSMRISKSFRLGASSASQTNPDILENLGNEGLGGGAFSGGGGGGGASSSSSLPSPMIPVETLRLAYLAATTQQFNTQDLLSTPPSWQLQERIILNARSFRLFELHQWHFHDCIAPLLHNNATPNPSQMYMNNKLTHQTLWARQESPVELIALLLELILQIAQLSASTNGSSSFRGSSSSSNNNNNNEDNSSGTSSTSNNFATTTTSDVTSGLELARLWMLFMDGITLLQTMSLANMDLQSAEAMAMFVNLFHLMLVHALLVVGSPTSIFKWQSLFRNCAYEAFGDVFSLAELEHNIIKNEMSRPSVNFIAKSFLPTSSYSFALQVRDYRLLFALNPASTSTIAYVPIYQPHIFSQQLDHVLRLNLDLQLIVTEDYNNNIIIHTHANNNNNSNNSNSNNNNNVSNSSSNSGVSVTITLPQTCQWYAKEFLYTMHHRITTTNSNPNTTTITNGTSSESSLHSTPTTTATTSSNSNTTISSSSGRKTPTPRELLVILAPYVRGEKGRKLCQYLGISSHSSSSNQNQKNNATTTKYALNIKYATFEFTCQMLRKLPAANNAHSNPTSSHRNSREEEYEDESGNAMIDI